MLEQYVYFGEQANVELAGRYFAAVDATCLQLVEHPESGVLHDSGMPILKDLRRFPVKGFENYLIFYLPRRNGIDVIRVLHGARNLDNLIAQTDLIFSS